jgi:hypothetical protein
MHGDVSVRVDLMEPQPVIHRVVTDVELPQGSINRFELARRVGQIGRRLAS